MAKTQTAAQTSPAVDEAALAEMRRLIFDAPIAELAESQGISIDEAVKLRVEKNLEEAPMPVSVTVRPIEPQGKLLGFASVNFGGVVVDDFKVVDGKNGVFLGAPSKPDPGSKFGYRTTARVSAQQLGKQGVPPVYAGSAPGPSGSPGTVSSRAAAHKSYIMDCPGNGPVYGRPSAGPQRFKDADKNL